VIRLGAALGLIAAVMVGIGLVDSSDPPGSAVVGAAALPGASVEDRSADAPARSEAARSPLPAASTGSRLTRHDGPSSPNPARSAPPARKTTIGPSRRPAAVSGAVRRGEASWYCCTRGYSSGALVAAAGPALRVGRWRGRYVTVCASRCVRARLVDWCGCPHRVIDLHPGVFRRLAPMSRGVVQVRVSW